MAETITLPAGQEITLSSYQSKKTGRQVELTNFVCLHNGKLLAPCQAFGDKKALLTEAMSSNKPVEVEGLTHNEQFKRWDVKFKDGAGSQAAYRGAFGGGGNRPWTPQGYRGQPFPFEVWVEVTTDVLVQSVNGLKMAAKGMACSDDVILEQARSLCAQYWMGVEHNLTFPKGFEPKAAAEPAAVVAAQPAAGTTPAQTTVVAEGGSVALYRQSIESATDTKLLDGLKATLLADATVDDESKVQLQMAILQRKKAIQPNPA